MANRLILALDVETRSCETCGASLVRKAWPCGKLETGPQFAERKFCSRACWPRVEDRFAEKVRVDPVTGCHIWTGALNNRGYGQVRVDGKTVLAHRVAWERKNGPLPTGMNALHSCDTPPCVNEEHLHPGTLSDNSMEMVARGRSPNTRKTSCPRGHPYDAENTYVYDGRRFCRRCNVIACARRDGRQDPALREAARAAAVRLVEVPA